jgi:hypothetical protein
VRRCWNNGVDGINGATGAKGDTGINGIDGNWYHWNQKEIDQNGIDGAKGQLE